MGWLSMMSMNGHATPRDYLDDQFTFERDTHRLKILRSTVVGKTVYYAACERVDAGGERIVFAIVCLIRHTPRARDGYIFAYKDMDETVGPCECACPAAILDLLTPTDYPHANDWRERCRATLAARPTPRPGQTIVFDAPITFSNGQQIARFEVVAHPRRRTGVVFRDPLTGTLCQISKVKSRAYRLVHSPSR